jgi:hypothetical protein
MAYFGRAAVVSKRVLPWPRSNPETARLQRQGPVSARLGVDVGTENYEPFSSLPVGMRVIGRFHQRQAKEPLNGQTSVLGLARSRPALFLKKSVIKNKPLRKGAIKGKSFTLCFIKKVIYETLH